MCWPSVVSGVFLVTGVDYSSSTRTVHRKIDSDWFKIIGSYTSENNTIYTMPKKYSQSEYSKALVYFPSTAARMSYWLCWPLYILWRDINFKQLFSFSWYTIECPTCHLHRENPSDSWDVLWDTSQKCCTSSEYVSYWSRYWALMPRMPMTDLGNSS